MKVAQHHYCYTH